MMKTNIIIAIVSCFMATVSIAQNEKEKIDDLLTNWHNAAADVNQQAYFDYIADDGIYIGTDSTEIWTKPEFYDWSKPHFEKAKTWTFKANSRNIYLSDNGHFAWFDELVSYGKGTLRGSGVLAKEDDNWKIKHYVLSLPVPNEKFKEVIDILKNNNVSNPVNGE